MAVMAHFGASTMLSIACVCVRVCVCVCVCVFVAYNRSLQLAENTQFTLRAPLDVASSIDRFMENVQHLLPFLAGDQLARERSVLSRARHVAVTEGNVALYVSESCFSQEQEFLLALRILHMSIQLALVRAQFVCARLG